MSFNIPKTNIINHTLEAEIASLPKEKEIIVASTMGKFGARVCSQPF